MGNIKILLSLSLLLFVCVRGFSQYKAVESFDYPAGTSLDTLEGNGGSGWAGPWDHFDLNSDAMAVADSGFNYSDLMYPVPHEGNFMLGANQAAWGGQRYGRFLAQRWPNEDGKVYWISTLFELQNFTTNGWALVSFYDGESEKAGLGHEWGNDSLGVAVYNPEGHSNFTADDGPQWLVAAIYMSGDTLNNVYLWVSPEPSGGEPDTNAANAKGRWNLINGFDRIAVHFGGEGVGMTMAVDEIRLGETWASVSSPLTGVSMNNNTLPQQFTLSQNYPNPFNPTTTISYSLPLESTVKLTVYDMMGREILVLVNNETRLPGTHVVPFNAMNLPSGVYFYNLRVQGLGETKSMLLLK